eukprot:3122889-Amphidinium_carterae.1
MLYGMFEWIGDILQIQKTNTTPGSSLIGIQDVENCVFIVETQNGQQRTVIFCAVLPFVGAWGGLTFFLKYT